MSLSQGSDAIIDQKLGYAGYNRLKNHFIKATNPGDLQDGMIWFDSANQTWKGKRTAGLFDFTLTPAIFPEGMIIPWIGGYFTNGSNGGYTRVLGASNDPAGINALLNSAGWYVCDGAALNIPESTIYNGAGRYLPNLTDDRFLMGDNLVGTVGGSNSNAHTHGAGTLVNAAEAAHTHAGGTLAAAAVGDHDHLVGNYAIENESSHIHPVNPPSTTSGGPSATIEALRETMDTVASDSHTHDVDIAEFNSGAGSAHSHALSGFSGSAGGHGHSLSGATAAGSSHNHAISGSTGAASATENRPQFLGIIFLQYVLAT
jgi:hypothetical protein